MRLRIPACVAVIGLATLGLNGCGKDKSVSEAEHLEKAKTYQSQGKYQAQVIEIKNLLQKNPNHPEGHFLLGETYANLGYGIDAEKELRRAQELGVDAERIKVPLGKSLLDQKEYKRVLNEIRPVIASTPATVAGIKTLYAQANLGLKEFEKGCELFREAKQADAKYIPAYWGVSQCSLGFGKPIEAAEELDAALKIDEKNADTWLLRGDLWRAQKQSVEAEKAYAAGLTHKPEHLMLLLARASVRIINENQAGALEDIKVADKQFKDHPLAQHYRGILLFKEKKYADAKAMFESVLRANPDYLPTILWAGLADYALNNLEQASHFFSQYVSAVPNATQVEAFLAITRARLGGKKAAAELLAKLGTVDIDDPQSLVLLGQAHLLTGDEKAGARYLTRAIEKQPDTTDLRMNLVAALLQKGDTKEAIHQAEAVLKKSPKDPRANRIMIAALLENGETDKALEIIKNFERELPDSPIPLIFRAAVRINLNDLKSAKVDLERANTLQPGNALVGHALAGIAIHDNQFDEARRYYKQVREKHNDPIETLMAMYDLEVRAKDAKAARTLVETAIAKYPKAARPATIIAAAYTRAGLPDKAIELSAEAASANPDNPDLLAARGAAFIDKGDIQSAIINFNRIVKLHPDMVEAHVKLAMVQEATGDFGGLKTTLQNALRLDPKHRRARLMQVSQNVRDKKYDDALKTAISVEQDFPNGIDAYILQSKVLMQLKRESEAVEALERAQKMAPKSEIPVIEMAKLRFFANQNELGFKSLQSWLQTNPGNIRANAFLAESFLAFKKEDAALETYKKILTLEPGNLIALNNVANLLGDKDPKLALPYAEQAFAAYPADPAITDTLGWLLLKTGNKKRGLELVKRALEAAPGAPDIQFHHAFALAENGDKIQAKRELEKILKNQKDFPTRAEAQALFSAL